MKTKAISVAVSYVLIAAISIVAISAVLSIGLPAIDRAKDAALINEAKNIMQLIDANARQVLFEGNGAQRVFSVSSTGGDYFSEKSTDRIVFRLNSISGVIDLGARKTEGNLLITAGTDVKASEYNYSADTSLVGYWKLNSVNSTNYTLDFTPNHNDGQLKNYAQCGSGASICNLTAGQIGNALQFDGVNDYVDVPSSSIGTTNQMTIELWTNPGIQTLGAYDDHKDIIRSECYGGGLWSISTAPGFNASNRLQIEITWISGVITWWSPANAVAVKGEWNQLALILNRDTGNASFYRNGGLVAETTQTVGTKPTTTGIRIASDCAGPFNGTIDEVRIYNRSLSADEIRQHYYQGLRKLELGTNLVLENDRIIFEVPKIGAPSAPAAINNSQLVDKITIKENGLNITPADSGTVVDGSPLSVNGTGYTQLMQTGDLLREASIKAYIESGSGANYEIWYILRSNADFVLEEVRNIVYR